MLLKMIYYVIFEPFIFLNFNIIKTDKYFTNLNVTIQKFEENLNKFNIWIL